MEPPNLPPPEAAQSLPTPSVAAIVLAAGSATRMGAPKQLIQFRGTSLLRRAAETALAAGVDPVVVVLGAHAELVTPELAHLPVQIVTNSGWSAGIGSSIRAGVASLPKSVDALLIVLADQPLVTPHLLRSLIDEHRSTAAPIVATAYNDTLGVPALFARLHFRDLATLSDASGAKSLIENAGRAAVSVLFPDGAIDIDTPADLLTLLPRDTGGSSR